MKIEHTDFVSVQTRDVERARVFYAELLSLPVSNTNPVGFEVETGNLTLGVINMESIGRSFEPSHSPIALRVPDVAAARAELEEKGVEFFGETMDSGVCRMAVFADPDGNVLMLHRRYAPYE